MARGNLAWTEGTIRYPHPTSFPTPLQSFSSVRPSPGYQPENSLGRGFSTGTNLFQPASVSATFYLAWSSQVSVGVAPSTYSTPPATSVYTFTGPPSLEGGAYPTKEDYVTDRTFFGGLGWDSSVGTTLSQENRDHTLFLTTANSTTWGSTTLALSMVSTHSFAPGLNVGIERPIHGSVDHTEWTVIAPALTFAAYPSEGTWHDTLADFSYVPTGNTGGGGGPPGPGP